MNVRYSSLSSVSSYVCMQSFLLFCFGFVPHRYRGRKYTAFNCIVCVIFMNISCISNTFACSVRYSLVAYGIRKVLPEVKELKYGNLWSGITNWRKETSKDHRDLESTLHTVTTGLPNLLPLPHFRSSQSQLPFLSSVDRKRTFICPFRGYGENNYSGDVWKSDW